VEVAAMARPAVGERAEMLTGSPNEVAQRLAEMLSARGLL
jgi:hypothetical protein